MRWSPRTCPSILLRRFWICCLSLAFVYPRNSCAPPSTGTPQPRLSLTLPSAGSEGGARDGCIGKRFLTPEQPHKNSPIGPNFEGLGAFFEALCERADRKGLRQHLLDQREEQQQERDIDHLSHGCHQKKGAVAPPFFEVLWHHPQVYKPGDQREYCHRRMYIILALCSLSRAHLRSSFSMKGARLVSPSASSVVTKKTMWLEPLCLRRAFVHQQGQYRWLVQRQFATS